MPNESPAHKDQTRQVSRVLSQVTQQVFLRVQRKGITPTINPGAERQTQGPCRLAHLQHSAVQRCWHEGQPLQHGSMPCSLCIERINSGSASFWCSHPASRSAGASHFLSTVFKSRAPGLAHRKKLQWKITFLLNQIPLEVHLRTVFQRQIALISFLS